MRPLLVIAGPDLVVRTACMEDIGAVPQSMKGDRKELLLLLSFAFGLSIVDCCTAFFVATVNRTIVHYFLNNIGWVDVTTTSSTQTLSVEYQHLSAERFTDYKNEAKSIVEIMYRDIFGAT
jgi:hypothetical protein